MRKKKTVDFRPKIADPECFIRNRIEKLRKKTLYSKEGIYHKIFEAGLAMMEQSVK